MYLEVPTFDGESNENQVEHEMATGGYIGKEGLVFMSCLELF